MNYGEGLNLNVSNEFSFVRPTIVLPLDELLDAPEMTTTSVPQDVQCTFSPTLLPLQTLVQTTATTKDLISTSTLSTVPPISLPKSTKPTQKPSELSF